MTRYCHKYADIHLTRQGLLLTNLSKVSGSPQSYFLQSQEWVTMGSPQNSSKVATANLPISLYPYITPGCSSRTQDQSKKSHYICTTSPRLIDDSDFTQTSEKLTSKCFSWAGVIRDSCLGITSAYVN